MKNTNKISKSDLRLLKKTLSLSILSVKKGGYPVGAIVTKNGTIISEGLSNGKNKKDATSHAEIDAIRNASKKLGKRDLENCTIYTSLEPCLMCFSACYWAKIDKIFYACRKKIMAKKHFEGKTELKTVNSENNKKIAIIHVADFETKAKEIIEKWETTRSKGKNNA